ncbi:sigS mRNA-stabilizing protein SroA [Staphylococcus pasteuri]|uniref:sigS mRNA-stabilizing protein SroA n=1 Tax=Staphylococcus pasteuri TaxID=45972 RepID=UPI001F2C8E6D|nr:DUF1659 domain-containing protein [Staphylococcus pasteuri]MCF7600416.1 DUF1659 domain-containing protein [Staphylococcus pasteuri]
MNEVNQLVVVLTRVTYDSEGKATQHKRRFSNLKPTATDEQIKTFSFIIERLTGESFDKVEAIRTQALV